MSSFSIHERRSDHLSFQLEPFLLVVTITLPYVHFDFASWNLYAFDLKWQRNEISPETEGIFLKSRRWSSEQMKIAKADLEGNEITSYV